MDFCNRQAVSDVIEGKRVAIIGSGPGVLANEPGYIDSHQVVVRVNNYKTSLPAGFRTDVFYSFFGRSVRKTAEELNGDGVSLCLAKCPDAHCIDSEWHIRNGKMRGVDFREIYKERKGWWFCPTYVPSVDEFMRNFEILGGRVPTTGFSAILDVLSYKPASVYLSGFDFFQSKIHNVNEPWNRINPNDPIGHVPDGEKTWLAANMSRYPITVDTQLALALKGLVKPDQSVRRAAQIAQYRKMAALRRKVRA